MRVTVDPFFRGGVISTELVIETSVHSRDLTALPLVGAGEFRPDRAELAAPRGPLAALAGAVSLSSACLSATKRIAFNARAR